MKQIKHLVFDFGGCIDAPGVHTRVLFWDAFEETFQLSPSQKHSFQEAYSLADQRMMKTGEAKNLALLEFNRWNARLIAETMGLEESKSIQSGDLVSDKMVKFLKRSEQALVELEAQFPLSIISNFTGNLNLILKEFGMLELFSTLTESYYEGFSKPDERIFLSAQKKIGLPPSALVYIGDNPKNDILPAKRLGWSAIIIGESETDEADARISDLRELKKFFLN